MTRAREPRRYAAKAIVGAFALLGLLLCHSNYLEERRLNREIGEQKDALLKLGIDLREPKGADDAIAAYQQILQEEGSFTDGQVLAQLESASRMPISTSPMLAARERIVAPDVWILAEVYDLLRHLSTKAVEAKRTDQLGRIIDLYFAVQRQAISAGRSGTYIIWSDESPAYRTLLRQKLAALDYRPFLMANLAALVRETRVSREQWMVYRGMHITHSSADSLRKLWEATVDGLLHTKLKSELLMLRTVRSVAEASLTWPERYGIFARAYREIGRRLQADRSREAKVLVAPLGFTGFYVTPKATLALVRMDVNESRRLGHPLVPTWSKPYCFDEGTGDPAKVRATRDRLTWSTRSLSITIDY